MTFAKFQRNRFKIDREIAENLWSWLIIFNLTAGILGWIIFFSQFFYDGKYNFALKSLEKNR